MANKSKRGRKSKYEDYVQPRLEEVKKWIENGATEEQICKNLGVAVSTFNEYKNKYPELMEVLKNGRISIVEKLRGALVKSALGFEYTESKTYKKRDENGNEIAYTEISKKYSTPNVAAINLALKNYDKDGWANDPQMMELRKMELEFKKEMAEKENW